LRWIGGTMLLQFVGSLPWIFSVVLSPVVTFLVLES